MMQEDKRTTYIDLHGKRYPLCLTVAANEKINDAFGGLKGMSEAMKQDSSKALGLYSDLLHILMEGGENRQKALAWLSGETAACDPVPPKDILMSLLCIADISAYKAKIMEAIALSSRATVEVEPDNSKNGNTTQG